MYSIYPRTNLVTKSYDGCAMRVVFRKLQNCADSSDGDFRDGGSAFQHMGPEIAKVHEPYVTVLVRKKSRSPWLLPADDDELWQLTVVHTVTTDMMGPARVDICKRAGRVCVRYVDRPVASGAHCELSLKSKHDRTCATPGRVELHAFKTDCSERMVTHQLQVERRRGKVCCRKTGVLPLCRHATKKNNKTQ